MSAFSPQSSGLGVFIVGGIVAILIVAAGFSGLSKNLFESTSSVELNEERAGRIHDQGVLLASVRRDLIRQKKLLVEQERLVEPVFEAQKLRAELEVFHDEVADLQFEASKRGDEIEELKKKRSLYRAEVRRKIWPRYLGMELKAEHLAGAMRYQNPKISKIYPAGISVMHSSGAARIQVSELSEKLRTLLDLDIAEANQLMRKMLINDARERKRRGKRADQAGQPTEAELEAMVATSLLEGIAKVEKYVDLIQYAEETARTAHYNDRHSSSRSVPGKLETWATRAKRFDAVAEKYQKELDATLEELRKIDPDFKSPRF